MPRTITIALVVIVVSVTLVSGAMLVIRQLEHRADENVTRVESAFPPEDSRPPAEPDELTVLLLGQDWHPEAQEHGRSDAIMLVRIPAHRSSVMVVSIPRDSWVPLPGHGEGKINSALVLGGPALAVETVEGLTGMRIDHVMMIDDSGFRRLTDALGGVTIRIPETVHDSARDITWTQGTHHLDGAGALDYVGQRYGLPNGDLDRVRRHQNLLRALMTDLIEENSPDNPLALYRLIDAMSESIVLDDEWSIDELREDAKSLRYLEASEVTFTTAPVLGLGREGDQSVVHLDPGRGQELWTAVREDWGSDWVDQQGAALSEPVP